MMNTDLLSEVSSNIFLFLLMFGMSATVDYDNLVHQLRNRYAIAIGLFMQFLIMPAFGFLAVALFKTFISPAIGVTLLVVTSSPGGSYSNWWCSLFNADLALSVAMTALSTVLSTLLLPANLMLYSHITYGDDDELMKAVNWKTIYITLPVVLIAIMLGLYSSYKMRSMRFQLWSNRLGTLSGILLIIFSLVISSQDEATRLWNHHWRFYVVVLLLCVLGLIFANVFAYAANLKKSECVTLSVECCYQNVGIATAVAITMFGDDKERGEALCVPLFYGAVEAVMLGIYCTIAWKAGWSKAPKDENFCVVLGTSYEVAPDDEDNGENNSPEQKKDVKVEFGATDTFETANLGIDSPIPGRCRLDTDEMTPSVTGRQRFESDGEEFIIKPLTS